MHENNVFKNSTVFGGKETNPPNDTGKQVGTFDNDSTRKFKKSNKFTKKGNSKTAGTDRHTQSKNLHLEKFKQQSKLVLEYRLAWFVIGAIVGFVVGCIVG